MHFPDEFDPALSGGLDLPGRPSNCAGSLETKLHGTPMASSRSGPFVQILVKLDEGWRAIVKHGGEAEAAGPVDAVMDSLRGL